MHNVAPGSEAGGGATPNRCGVGACVDVSRFGSGRDTQRRQQFVMYRTDHTRRQRHPLAACGCAKSSTIRREPLEVRKATLA
jgi:hypothetical protein